ncbi:hypothetical protein [Nitrosomonas communis]|uniref:Uncharacterized protein n=1 Tax=Nitrosomonas communis TaxID=44574 RepID=A0A1I4X7C5_9PROT|nr:hypothetical protein [Nitrosomonas communis]SFN21605.1 hypothetical protein SAMN05421863_11391 [Nitrosomonas communis]
MLSRNYISNRDKLPMGTPEPSRSTLGHAAVRVNRHIGSIRTTVWEDGRGNSPSYPMASSSPNKPQEKIPMVQINRTSGSIALSELIRRLENAEGRTIQEQLEVTARQAPELHAVFHMLALVLLDEIDRAASSQLCEATTLSVLPPVVLDSMLGLQVPDGFREEIRRRICRWKTRVWFEKLRKGELEEWPEC